MSTRLKQILLAVLLIVAYVSIGQLGETGKMVYTLLGNFAVGWLVMDIAKAIIKD